MRNELRGLIRYANIVLAVTIPIIIGGAILLRDASEGVLQVFVLTMFFFPIAIVLGLGERARRRRQRGQ